MVSHLHSLHSHIIHTHTYAYKTVLPFSYKTPPYLPTLINCFTHTTFTATFSFFLLLLVVLACCLVVRVLMKNMEALLNLRPLLALLLVSILALHISEVSGATMTLYNKCSHPVWPGIQPSAGKPLLARGGFKLPPNKAYTMQLPAGWSGRVWGRHGCSFDASGRGRCATGDCGGALFCNGLGGAPPATLAEITLGNDQDFYDVSLVDGYNLAISITPFRGSGKCSYAGCVSDLNMMCPVGLQVWSHDKKRVVACKSACFAFNSPRYCCTGSFGNPQSCKPTAYSRIFKAACPKAYSYAYDDPTSIATCTGGSYLLTFCPTHRH